jgi:hypothetical protein
MRIKGNFYTVMKNEPRLEKKKKKKLQKKKIFTLLAMYKNLLCACAWLFFKRKGLYKFFAFL